jgi:small subunit ribosomal protein S16
MLTIRLARVGKKNKAQFQIVLQEHAIAPGGRHVEILGSYDPHSKATVLKEEKIKYWLSKGAKASPTVHNLLVSKNIVSGKKIAVKIPKKAEVKSEESKPEEKKDEVAKEEKAEESKTEEKPEAISEEKASASAKATADKEEKKVEPTAAEAPADK